MRKRKQEKSLTKTVVRNTFFMSIYGVIAKIGGFIFTIVVARMLFPELFGLYSLALTIIITLSTITDLGIGGTIIRYISESLGRKGKRKKAEKEARSRFLFLLKFKFLLALTVGILLFFLAVPLSLLFKEPGLVLPLQIGSIYLFVIGINKLVNSLFFAVQRLKYLTIAKTIFEFSRIPLIFIFLSLYKTVASVFVVLILALFFALVFAFIIINKKYSFLFKGKKEPVERRRLFIFTAFLALASLSTIIFTVIDKLMLGYFIEAKFLGFYTTIVALVGGVVGLISFSIVSFPAFTQLKGERLKKAFQKVFHYLFLFAFPATIGLAYIMLPALQVFYGQAYVPTDYRTVLLITSVFLSFTILGQVIASLYIILFNAKERPKIPALTTTIAAITNIILNFIFISYLISFKPEYGLIGAATATFISFFIYVGSLATLSKAKLKIGPVKKSILKPLFATLVMLAYLIAYDYFVPLNLVRGIAMILGAIIIYFGMMFLIRGIKKEDFKLLRLLK